MTLHWPDITFPPINLKSFYTVNKVCPFYDEFLDYAETLREYPEEPWKQWEYTSDNIEGWITCTYHPAWVESFYYRRKLK